jgi:hypothetical protein
MEVHRFAFCISSPSIIAATFKLPEVTRQVFVNELVANDLLLASSQVLVTTSKSELLGESGRQILTSSMNIPGFPVPFEAFSKGLRFG